MQSGETPKSLVALKKYISHSLLNKTIDGEKYPCSIPGMKRSIDFCLQPRTSVLQHTIHALQANLEMLTDSRFLVKGIYTQDVLLPLETEDVFAGITLRLTFY